MYKIPKILKTTIRRNTSYTGETIESKVKRILNNNEPIKDGAPVIYTERKDGVQPSYNIRTDRFEVAVDAMDKITKSHQAKREERAKVVPMDTKKGEVGEPKSIEGTESKS